MIHNQSIIHVVFLIFAGTAILTTIALFTRQSLLVAYILLGAILGPWGLQLVNDSTLIKETGDIGIIFLLFLLGLDLQPQSLWNSLQKMSWITFASSAIFFVAGFSICSLFGFNTLESFIVGITMMFSSTIIGIKLLPTTILHHQHTGEIMISILLLQDLIAIAVILVIQALFENSISAENILMVSIGFPILLMTGYFFEKYILTPLLIRFDKIHEYIFILSIGWCLFMGELAHFIGLSEEIGAFIAGISLASNPISLYVADSLKPLRDFFLVIFFFTIGAGFNFSYLPTIFWPAFILAGTMLVLKPVIFRTLLKLSGEPNSSSWEIGTRLGQVSEFSLLVIYLALTSQLVSENTTYLVQATTIITFIVSCYWIVLQYPTPLASSDKLRRD